MENRNTQVRVVGVLKLCIIVLFFSYSEWASEDSTCITNLMSVG